jgi:hypothetical protein
MITAPADINVDNTSDGAVHLFDVVVQYTAVVDYGFTFEQSVAGEPIPEQGARIDIFFEGEIRGERLRGKISGVDYVTLGPDRVSRLHIHAHITTHDGHHIAVHAEGLARRRPGSTLVDVHETISFSTAAEQYRWLNEVRAFSTGLADTRKGGEEARIMQSPPPSSVPTRRFPPP